MKFTKHEKEMADRLRNSISGLCLGMKLKASEVNIEISKTKVKELHDNKDHFKTKMEFKVVMNIDHTK